jgi:DNA adenine methylase
MTGPLSYVGGKNRLAKTIIPLIPKHKTYVEPFFGGGQVFFHKDPSAVEIINDLSDEIVNFFRICQSHHEELVRYLKYMLISRKWFELCQDTDPSRMTDIQKAGRFFYLQKNCFGGLVNSQRPKLTIEQHPNYNPERIPELLAQTHERLQRVQIECLPYQEILKRCDRPETFFYLDPPYWDKVLYRFNFKEQDFIELNQILKNLAGKFILSLNDLAEVRKLFADFRIQEVSLSYTAASLPGRKYRELLIANF